MVTLHRLNDVLGAPKLLGALVILNGPSLSRELLDLVWPAPPGNPQYPVICADGGANLLFDVTRDSTLRSEGGTDSPDLERVPTYIVGDLDSLRPEVRTWYEARGTKVVLEPSVDSDDFHKAMKLVNQICKDREVPTVVIGGHGGRIDQTLGNLNTLYCCAESGRSVYWLEKSNLILALSAGKHHINIDPSLEGPKCGIIPVGKPVKSVSTEGLKWNLDSQELAFGTNGLISTSNEVQEQVVVIEASSPVMWTSELRL